MVKNLKSQNNNDKIMEPKFSEYKKLNFQSEKLGNWEKISNDIPFIISVVYDLPDVATPNNLYGKVFDQSHWFSRICLLKFASLILSGMNIKVICLPADFIGYPNYKGNILPESSQPSPEILQDIKNSWPYSHLLQAWDGISETLIFGYGFDGLKIEGNQLVCVVIKPDNRLQVVRKWTSDDRKNPQDWNRRIDLTDNLKLSIAVCRDLENYFNPKSTIVNPSDHYNRILINCRHLSRIGLEKENEDIAETTKRTGSTHSGRLGKVIGERLPYYKFSHIFFPVFRFKDKVPEEWNPTQKVFAWAAQNEYEKPSYYLPLASLKVENREKNERAFFNIFQFK